MKLAVCFSGQPRCLDECVLGIKNFFSECEVDYYIHSWDRIHSYRGGLDKVHSIESLEKWYADNYNPVGLEVQGPESLEKAYSSQFLGITYESAGMFFQIYSAVRALQKVDLSTYYDAVVLTRPDFFIYNGILDQQKLQEAFRSSQVPQRALISLERQSIWTLPDYIGFRIPDVFLVLGLETVSVFRDKLFLIWMQSVLKHVLCETGEGWEYLEQILPEVCTLCKIDVIPADLFQGAAYRYPLPKEFSGILEGKQQEAQTDRFLRFCYECETGSEDFRNAGYETSYLRELYEESKKKLV